MFIFFINETKVISKHAWKYMYNMVHVFNMFKTAFLFSTVILFRKYLIMVI